METHVEQDHIMPFIVGCLSCYCMISSYSAIGGCDVHTLPCTQGVINSGGGSCVGMLTKHTICCAAGWPRVLQESLIQTSGHISWDTWALTAAAASLSWVLWRRHKRFLQTRHTSHTPADRETGVG